MPAEEVCGSVWIRSYLQSLPHELDVDVISDYISAILEEVDLPVSSLSSEIDSLLSAYLPDDVCKTSSSEIVRHFTQSRDPNPSTPLNLEVSSSATNGLNEGGMLTKMEEQMRALLQANYDKQLKAAETRASEQRGDRDAVTKAVLREAGVAGYQGDSEDEKDVEIAITNAAFEAEQGLDADVPIDALEVNGSTDVVDREAENELDLQDLEDRSGYGIKDGVKPGTVEDALSILNPSLFGSSSSTKKPFPPGATRLPTPGPRPMGFKISGGIPAPVVSVPSHVANGSTPTEDGGVPSRKKKQPTTSKHIAKIGALAEAKGKAKSSRSGGSTAVRARQEEMASFLFSDSEDEVNTAPLPEGGKNRERIVAVEQAAREAAAAQCAQKRNEDKVIREAQLAQQAKRKQAAQQKVQKIERRR